MEYYLLYLFKLLLLQQTTLTVSQNLALCGQTCECEEKVQHYAPEFRVICNGTSNQGLFLNGSIFEKEPVPDFGRTIYVRANNFSFLNVDPSFFSHWLSYTSCSFDIWNCANTTFPTTYIEPAESDALSHDFAGIAILRSELNQFPPRIFSIKKEIRIRILYSKVAMLNIQSLEPKAVNFLDIQSSTIANLEGNTKQGIQLGSSMKYGEARLHVFNSHIGAMHANSLVIRDYEGKQANISIENSTVGYLESDAVSLGKNVTMKISQCNIGYMFPSSLKTSFNGYLVLKNSVLGLEPNSIKNLNCFQGGTSIYNNIIIPFKSFENCSEPEVSEDTKSIYCSRHNISDRDFVHKTCRENHIWLISSPKSLVADTQMTSSSSATLAPLNPTTPAPFSPTTLVPLSLTTLPPSKPANSSSINESLKTSYAKHIPTGLFYIITGVSIILLIVIFVLIGVLICHKVSSKKQQFNSKIEDSSNIYDEPQYFGPKNPVALQDMTVTRYSGNPSPSPNQPLVLKTEDVYVNMN